jgi:hypothetical protein
MKMRDALDAGIPYSNSSALHWTPKPDSDSDGVGVIKVDFSGVGVGVIKENFFRSQSRSHISIKNLVFSLI